MTQEFRHSCAGRNLSPNLQMDPRIREDDPRILSFLRRACPRPDRGQESIPCPCPLKALKLLR